MTDVKTSLKTVLNRLKLSGMLLTLPDRAAYAARAEDGFGLRRRCVRHQECQRSG